ncbi:uncharacterized protein LOC144556179 isoform X2 [Carex rostrata]
MAKIIPLFLLFLIASSLVIQSKALSEASAGELPVERAIGFTGLMSWWDMIRSWPARLALFKHSPESRYRSGGASTPTGKVTEAATESWKMAEGTVEQAAESAAEIVNKAAHTAKKKLERTMSIHPRRKRDSSSAEL